MYNNSLRPFGRRELLRAVLLGGVWGIVGCSDSGGGVQTVTTPPSATGTRARLDKYKDSVENAAKKNKRRN